MTLTKTLFHIFLIIFQMEMVNCGEVPIENTCGEAGGKLWKVVISECDRHPCKFYRGKPYTVDATFSPGRNSTFGTIKCGTMLYNKPQSLIDIDACEGLSEGSCPFVENQNYTFTKTFKISKMAPPITYNVQCQCADDEGINQFCAAVTVVVLYS